MADSLQFAAFALLTGILGSLAGRAQTAPSSPAKIWHSPAEEKLAIDSAPPYKRPYEFDQAKIYTLAELVDLAQSHNPETRVAWETAKGRAAALGIARAAFLPTITAVALAQTVRQASLLGEYFHRQTLGIFEPVLHVEYLVFDYGNRSGGVDAAKANLLAADLAFNDTHRKIIFQVASAYYSLLNARGQREAAEISLKNAQEVEEDAENRLTNGLATKPDQLEAAAARAQADYDLQAALGKEEIAAGNLATALGLPPDTKIQVQPIAELPLPAEMTDSVDREMDLAFAKRPDLLQQLARVRASNATIKQAHSSYIPTLSFTGDGGLARAYGQQDLLPGSYAQGEVWNVSLDLRWTLFDGTRREHELAQAVAEKRAAQAEVDALRDEIANEVWAAYSNMKIALRQEQAAAALLTASEQSFEAAHESYGYGVRSLLDVVSAQKTLAQARSEDVFARTQLLLQVANLSFRTGYLIEALPPKVGP